MRSKFEKQYDLFEKDWWWFAGRHDLVSRIFCTFGLENNRVLEIGCCSGENSKIFNDSIIYYGVDISLNVIKRGNCNNDKNNKNKNLILSDANHLPFSDKKFDVVLMLDVLEHIEDDILAIEEAHRVLKDDGFMIVLVPAFEFLWDEHDILNEHKRRYTKSGLATKINRKFNMARMSYWNFFLFVPIALMKIIKRIRMKKTADFVALPDIVNNTLFLNILKIENYLIQRKIYIPIGVSIVCICKNEKNENYPDET